MFGTPENGSPSEWRRIKKHISAIVLQSQLRHQARSVIQENQFLRERAAAIRGEIQDLRKQKGRLRQKVSLVTGQSDVAAQEASSELAGSFLGMQSGMKIARKPDLLPCPECGLAAKLYQEINGVVKASVFCGNAHCGHPAI